MPVSPVRAAWRGVAMCQWWTAGMSPSRSAPWCPGSSVWTHPPRWPASSAARGSVRGNIPTRNILLTRITLYTPPGRGRCVRLCPATPAPSCLEYSAASSPGEMATKFRETFTIFGEGPHQGLLLLKWVKNGKYFREISLTPYQKRAEAGVQPGP